MNSLIRLTIFSLVLAGCSVGPSYQKPLLDLPTTFDNDTPSLDVTSLADLPWWQVFGDEALFGLIDEAVVQAHEVRISAWRVEEARSAAGIARAGRFPAADAGLGRSRGRDSRSLVPDAQTGDLYDVHLGV